MIRKTLTLVGVLALLLSVFAFSSGNVHASARSLQSSASTTQHTVAHKAVQPRGCTFRRVAHNIVQYGLGEVNLWLNSCTNGWHTQTIAYGYFSNCARTVGFTDTGYRCGPQGGQISTPEVQADTYINYYGSVWTYGQWYTY